MWRGVDKRNGVTNKGVEKDRGPDYRSYPLNGLCAGSAGVHCIDGVGGGSSRLQESTASKSSRLARQSWGKISIVGSEDPADITAVLAHFNRDEAFLARCLVSRLFSVGPISTKEVFFKLSCLTDIRVTLRRML